MPVWESMTRISLLCITLIFAVLFYPVTAGFTAEEYIHSTGSLHINNDQTLITGDNISGVWRSGDQYSEINAGQQIVTGPGNSKVDTQVIMTAGYEQNTDLKYSGGGAVWDTLYLGSSIPNESVLTCTAGSIGSSSLEGVTAGTLPLDQSINGQIGAQGPNGEFKSGKYASETSYALSGDFVGRGAYYGDILAAAGAGSDSDSNEQNYKSTMHRHVLGTSNFTGGVIASTDWSSDDPREILNFTAAVNVTTNVTQTNETAIDESGNETPEEEAEES